MWIIIFQFCFTPAPKFWYIQFYTYRHLRETRIWCNCASFINIYLFRGWWLHTYSFRIFTHILYCIIEINQHQLSLCKYIDFGDQILDIWILFFMHILTSDLMSYVNWKFLLCFVCMAFQLWDSAICFVWKKWKFKSTGTEFSFARNCN